MRLYVRRKTAQNGPAGIIETEDSIVLPEVLEVRWGIEQGNARTTQEEKRYLIRVPEPVEKEQVLPFVQ